MSDNDIIAMANNFVNANEEHFYTGFDLRDVMRLSFLAGHRSVYEYMENQNKALRAQLAADKDKAEQEIFHYRTLLDARDAQIAGLVESLRVFTEANYDHA